MMKPFFIRFATQLTLGLFVVSAISGVALFFHFAQGSFHSMHEWLSMLFLAPSALHLWKNWGAMVAYVRRGTLIVPACAMLLLGAAFAVPSLTGTGGGSGRGGSPFAAVQLMTQTSLATLAPVLQTTPDGLLSRLAAKGFTATSINDTLASIATTAGVPATRILSEILPAK